MYEESHRWSRLSNESASAEWNSLLSGFSNASPFQTFEQGLVAEADGWEAQYWISRSEEGDCEAMVVALVRRLPLRTGMVWIVGGVAGDATALDASLLEAIKEQNAFKRCYLRARVDAELNGLSALRLSVQGFRPSLFKIGSGQTVELDLTSDFDSGLSRTWKRSLKKADKNGLVVRRWENPDPAAMRELFADLEKSKGLDTLFTADRLRAIAQTAGLNLLIQRCDDAEGNLLAVRGQVVLGDHAVDYMAVTTERGRQLCASHLLVKESSRILRAMGVRTFELGGIDPEKNPGVTRFKIETGARKVVQLGEWDMATSRLLRLAANLAIKSRGFLETDVHRHFTRTSTTRRTEGPQGLEPTNHNNGVQAC